VFFQPKEKTWQVLKHLKKEKKKEKKVKTCPG
jgi:hypothetical protein